MERGVLEVVLGRSRRRRQHGVEGGEDKFDMCTLLLLDDFSKPPTTLDQNQGGLG
jgi:hypothetical protein